MITSSIILLLLFSINLFPTVEFDDEQDILSWDELSGDEVLKILIVQNEEDDYMKMPF